MNANPPMILHPQTVAYTWRQQFAGRRLGSSSTWRPIGLISSGVNTASATTELVQVIIVHLPATIVLAAATAD